MSMRLRYHRNRHPSLRAPALRSHPAFRDGFRRADVGRHELAFFAFLIRDLDPFIKEAPRLLPLRHECNLYATYDEAEAVRIFLGKRRTFRFDDKGRQIFESGAHLVYSLGPTGVIAIMLFPAQSALGSAVEEVIFLGVGSYGGGELASRLKGDLRSLAAYGHATSIDGSPTIGETLRVWWLRTFHPKRADGKFAKSPIGIHKAGMAAGFVTKTLFTASITAVLRPVALLLVIWWVLKHSPELMALLPQGFQPR